MTTGPQLFKINPSTRKSEEISEEEFAQLGYQERRDIQEWVAANPSILGEDLLIIAKEFSGFDRINERIDLLAVDVDGRLVVIELKRDDTGADAHWQAIKYASYLHSTRPEEIVRILADHEKGSKEEAEQKLLEHLNREDFTILNNDQRIILASHRFAPEVTSAVLWLNQKTPGENLITCIQLTPYRLDENTDTLYVQANRIIPVPGVDRVVIGGSQEGKSGEGKWGPGTGVRVKERAKAKDFRGKRGTIVQIHSDGYIQVAVGNVMKWMSPNSLETIKEGNNDQEA